MSIRSLQYAETTLIEWERMITAAVHHIITLDLLDELQQLYLLFFE